MVYPDTRADVLVVGAGLAGLLAAHRLQAANRKVIVLEKGRGFGGRMATRRAGEAVFDHGAQFFTVRDPRFQTLVQQWLEQGLVTVWGDGPWPGSKHLRYRGKPSMTAVPKHYAGQLDVRRQVKVTRLQREKTHWQAHAEDGTTYTAGHLLLTAPAPQTLDLLATAAIRLPSAAQSILPGIRYTRCLAAMLTLDGPSGIPVPGVLTSEQLSEPLAWVADNQQKGISPVPCLTLHSTPAFGQRHWDSPDEERLSPMIEAIQPRIDARITAWLIHRWGYAQRTSETPHDCLHLPELNLTHAGDGYRSSKVESAAISGLVAAEQILGCSFSATS